MADVGRFHTLALHLAQGATLRDAAGRAGVPERTAFRVLKKPKFRKLVRRCRSRLWRSLAGKLTAACEDAVANMQQIANDTATAATARVSACRGLLEAALKFKDSADFERRLASLEERRDPRATVDR